MFVQFTTFTLLGLAIARQAAAHIGAQSESHDGWSTSRSTPTSMPTSTSTLSPPLGATSISVPNGCVASMDGQLPSPTPDGFVFSGQVRRYYVAAEEVEWNYVPSGWDNWLGVPIGLSPRAKPLTTFGTTFLKALYRGYTDATFSQLSEQPPWQGTQGPTLRSEVGDMVEIMFVNNLSNSYATMHSMGLAYNKMNEGGDYPSSLRPGMNDTIPVSSAVPPVDRGIAPGGCVVYKWLVPPSEGPNDGEPARAHSYHSYVDLDVDCNSGLIGPQIVYQTGAMETTMKTHKEFPLLYMIYNEAHSFLSGENARKLYKNHSADAETQFGALDTTSLWPGNFSIWHPQLVNLNNSGQFGGAPSFHSMNGYMFANNPPFEMCEGDQVIWYAYAYGSDSHVFHMHGNGFTDDGRKQFAVSLNDGVSKTLYMNATDTGLWQVICHVSSHQQMGMVSDYLVRKKQSCGSNTS